MPGSIPAVKIDIELPGWAKLANRFQTAPQKVRAATESGLDEMAIYVQGRSRMDSPVLTGRLRSSIFYEVDHSKFLAKVSTNVYYAFFVHEGTRYIRANPFMTRAYAESIPFITQKMREIGSVIAKGLVL